MCLSNSTIRPASLLSGVLILFASACSKGADRAAPGATASSTPDTGSPTTTQTSAVPDTQTSAVPETAATHRDTPAVRTQGASAHPGAPRAGVRPSIDPGRKTTAPPKPAVPATVTPSPESAATAAAAEGGSQDKWLKYDAASKTVTFELIAGPFNWNGFASGGATLLLPPKSNVVMNFVNKDGTPHSAEVISGEGPIPNAAVDPAIPRAYTNKVLEGLPQEGSDVMRFTVPESGTYRIFCGVPGHGLSGMWIWMKVDPSAKAPSFGPTKA